MAAQPQVKDLAAAHEMGVAALRRALPINQYLHLLHVGALSGYLPRMDPSSGRIIEQCPMTSDGVQTDPNDSGHLDAKTRVSMLEYLTNKAMPDPKSENLVAPPPALERHLSLDDVRSMTNEELLAIAHRVAQVAEER